MHFLLHFEWVYSCLLYNGDKEDDDDEKPKNESKIRRISPLLKNSLKRSPMCKRFNCREKKLGDIKKFLWRHFGMYWRDGWNYIFTSINLHRGRWCVVADWRHPWWVLSTTKSWRPRIGLLLRTLCAWASGSIWHVQIVNLRLFHNLSTGNQLTKALLVSKGIARANASSTAVSTAFPPNVRVVRLGECLLAEKTLLHATSVAQRRVDGERVETGSHNGKEQNDEDYKEGEPELATRKCHPEAAQVLVVDKVAVDEECQCKVKGNWAPNDDVIEDRPVGGVQGNLQKEF